MIDDHLKIRNVCSRFSSGKSISASLISNSGQYPVFGGNGLRGYTDSYNFEGECVLIGRQGAYCGNVKYFSGKGYMTEHAIVAVANEYNDTRFLAYKFEMMNLGRYAGQSAQPGLSVETLLDVDIDVPEKCEQIKVTKVLSSIDSLIQINNVHIRKLKDVAKLLYEYWFIQFDFPGESGKPYKSSGGKMTWNNEIKRKIPDGWEVKTLFNCISKDKNAIVDGPFGTQMKVGEFVSEGVPIYEMDQLNGAFIVDDPNHFISEDKYEEVKRSTVRNGDIIISKTGTLGLLGIVNSEYDKGIIVSRLAKITPDPRVIGKFALLIHLQKLADSGYWHKVCGGSTMPILNNGTIGTIKILVPNNNLYTKFEEIVSPMYERIYCLQRKNKSLLSLRNFLLPMLMNGQVKVAAE